MSPSPLFLSPATPSTLLTSIINHQSHPTTLLIGCPRQDFHAALLHNLVSSQNSPADDAPSPLLSAPLYQTAVAKHVRVLFAPTVTHLRACLAVFTPRDSKTPPPPMNERDRDGAGRTPLLVLYGFLDLHRDSSEWSAQGVGCSAALVVEAAKRSGFKAVLMEPTGEDGHPDFQALLAQEIPLLGRASSEGTWAGRTVEVKRVLGRWFRFEDRKLGEEGVTCTK